MDFSNFLKKYMESENLTNRDVAKKIGINETIISMVKHNKRLPTYKLLISFFASFNISERVKKEIMEDFLKKKLSNDIMISLSSRNNDSFFSNLSSEQKEKFEKLKNTMIMALTLNDIKPTDEIIEQITRNAEDIFSKEYLNKIT